MPTDSITVPTPRVLVPGLRALPRGTERYRVVGGAATAVSALAGDVIEILDPSGRQRAEITAFDDNGTSDPGLVGA